MMPKQYVIYFSSLIFSWWGHYSVNIPDYPASVKHTYPFPEEHDPMLRQTLFTKMLPLTLAATLLAPLAASAQTPAPTPAVPAAPATPAARNANRLNGKITAVDATAKTITIKARKVATVLSVPDGTKIFKIGDGRKTPTGTFADLTVDARIAARTNGSADKPVATEIHLRPARGAARPAAPAAPAAPATPAP